METNRGDQTSLLNQETRDIWNQNAAFWDDYMGEGNAFQKVLIGPATERLLNLHPGELVLDIACGNGAFSRRMAQLGAQVVACDFAEVFIERAKQRTIEHADRIDYKVVDATDEAQLLALGERRFDAAVCTMAMMDMATIQPLVSALSRLLNGNGRFIFSVTHPCFNNSGITKVVEEEDRDGEIITTYALKVFKYDSLTTSKGQGVIGQPTPQYYFHRTLSTLFNTCFQAGFVLDGLEEPVFSEEADGRRPFSWANFKEIPPVLVARLRPSV
jgi:2-polyprenyl-3-methyl-5-hydroxy-6-metoxy-1,4-benzoquinol methylase